MPKDCSLVATSIFCARPNIALAVFVKNYAIATVLLLECNRLSNKCHMSHNTVVNRVH